MAEMRDYSIKVNGQARKVRATPDMPLLWALRQELDFAGVKFGCGAGLCGACTVHLDGQPVRSCQLPIGELGKGSVTTIEGLSVPLADKLRLAWLQIDVPQCGYCQAGQLMAAHALLKETQSPTRRPSTRPWRAISAGARRTPA